MAEEKNPKDRFPLEDEYDEADRCIDCGSKIDSCDCDPVNAPEENIP